MDEPVRELTVEDVLQARTYLQRPEDVLELPPVWLDLLAHSDALEMLEGIAEALDSESTHSQEAAAAHSE